MTVDSCCCGCSLRCGTIAIGCFYVCTSVVGAIGFFTLKLESYSEYSLRASADVVSCVCMIAGLVMLMQMLGAVCLIYGVKRDKSDFLVPWMIMNAMYLILALALITSLIVAGASSGSMLKTTLAVIEGVYIALLIYFLIVVHSYYRSLTLSKKAPQDA